MKGFTSPPMYIKAVTTKRHVCYGGINQVWRTDRQCLGKISRDWGPCHKCKYAKELKGDENG